MIEWTKEGRKEVRKQSGNATTELGTNTHIHTRHNGRDQSAVASEDEEGKEIGRLIESDAHTITGEFIVSLPIGDEMVHSREFSVDAGNN